MVLGVVFVEMNYRSLVDLIWIVALWGCLLLFVAANLCLICCATLHVG